MPYQVPQNIDPNKIFLVNFSDLQGRWDPKMSLFQKESKTFKYRVASLKDFLSKDPQYGAGESGIERTGISEPRYIRITDINDDGTLNDSLGATAQNIEEKYFLKENDILIARSGATVGKAYIHKNVFPYQCFFAGYLIRFVVSHYLLPDYFFVYTQLQVYKNWINAVQRPSGQPNINAEEYKSLPIPIPPKEIQQQIIDYYNSAYKSKLEKHQQAEALLQSIDDYLLGELGITLPKKTAFYNDYVCCEPEAVYYTVNDTFLDRNNELVQKGQIFITKFSEVTGGRLDPKLYSTEVKELKRAIGHSKYQTKPLSYFVVSDCSGDWGKDESDNVEEDKYTKCLVIRATEFDNTYNLRLDNSRVKYRQINNSKLSKMDIKENDLLIEKSGGSEDQPVGRIAILTNDIIQENTLAYSNFVHKISVEGINPQYLYFYLKTMYNIGITEPMQSQTNGIRNLIMPEYFNQNIAFPSLSKQLEIANHITEIRKQAKQLQDEGAEILRKAKEEVERMILE